MKKDRFNLYKFEDHVFAVKVNEYERSILKGMCLTGTEPRKLYLTLIPHWLLSRHTYYEAFIADYMRQVMKQDMTEENVQSQVLLVARDKEIEYEEEV